jgi:hypothetical protein
MLTTAQPPDTRSPRAPAPKSQTPTLVAALLGDLGFPAATEDQREHSPKRASSFLVRSFPWSTWVGVRM